MDWTAELDAILEVARSLSAADAAQFIGELEKVKAVAWQRLFMSASTTEQSRDELLNVKEAARRMGVSTKFLYANHGRFPFTRHIGRRLTFSAIGLDTYIRRNGAKAPKRR